MLQSTSLLRGKTLRGPAGQAHKMLQSTSLLRGKTHIFIVGKIIFYASIHFPLAREDRPVLPVQRPPGFASIHFPLAREDHKLQLLFIRQLRFNPLPSCEGRQSSVSRKIENFLLQSTSLLRGKTAAKRFSPRASAPLQSTSLLRGKT